MAQTDMRLENGLLYLAWNFNVTWPCESWAQRLQCNVGYLLHSVQTISTIWPVFGDKVLTLFSASTCFQVLARFQNTKNLSQLSCVRQLREMHILT